MSKFTDIDVKFHEQNNATHTGLQQQGILTSLIGF